MSSLCISLAPDGVSAVECLDAGSCGGGLLRLACVPVLAAGVLLRGTRGHLCGSLLLLLRGHGSFVAGNHRLRLVLGTLGASAAALLLSLLGRGVVEREDSVDNLLLEVLCGAVCGDDILGEFIHQVGNEGGKVLNVGHDCVVVDSFGTGSICLLIDCSIAVILKYE